MRDNTRAKKSEAVAMAETAGPSYLTMLRFLNPEGREGTLVRLEEKRLLSILNELKGKQQAALRAEMERITTGQGYLRPAWEKKRILPDESREGKDPSLEVDLFARFANGMYRRDFPGPDEKFIPWKLGEPVKDADEPKPTKRCYNTEEE